MDQNLTGTRLDGPIHRFLSHQRTLGRGYDREDYVLRGVRNFLLANDTVDLDRQLFDRWCEHLGALSANTRRSRQVILRKLCLHRRRSDPTCFVPDPLYFARPQPYREPVIVEPGQIGRMLDCASTLPASPNSPLRGEVLRLAVVLLYTAGPRRGEATRLTLGDIDAPGGVVRVRELKFHKSPLVPLSGSARRELCRYPRAREAACSDLRPDAPLLCNRWRGWRPYTGAGLGDGVSELFEQAGVRDALGRRPRPPPQLRRLRVDTTLRTGGERPEPATASRAVHGARLRGLDRALPALRAQVGRVGQRTLRPPLRSSGRGDGSMSRGRPTELGRAVRRFFEEYLPHLRGVSTHTVKSYRDALVLFLRFAASDADRSVDRLDITDLRRKRVMRFLDDLETVRGNGVATRNARLAALHTFARFLAAERPEHLETLQAVLAIPFKRVAREAPIEYFEADEMAAFLQSIDRTTAGGQRDDALFALLFNTGARVQEILDLRVGDLRLDPPYRARQRGKGGNVRLCPIWPATAQLLRALIDSGLPGDDEDPRNAVVFQQSARPADDAVRVRYRLRQHLAASAAVAPTLRDKRLHAHSLRHTTTVQLLKADVDFATISQWLGHASVNTTMRYARADIDLKRAALSQVFPETLGPPTGGSTVIDGTDISGWLRRSGPSVCWPASRWRATRQPGPEGGRPIPLGTVYAGLLSALVPKSSSNQCRNDRAISLSVSKYLAAIAVPNGRPGSSCQDSHAWTTALTYLTLGKVAPRLCAVVVDSWASVSNGSCLSIRSLRKCSRVPEARLSGMSHTPTRT